MLGSLFSGIGARRQARKAEKQLQERRDNLDREYAQDKNTNFLDTDAARSTLALLRRQNRRAEAASNNNAVRSGATAEQRVATAGRLNENYANAASRIAGMGTQYQQRIKENYQNRRDQLDNALYNVQMQKANATNNMIGAITSATGGLISAFGMGGNASGPSKAAAARAANSRQKLIETVGNPTPAAPDLSQHVQPLSYSGPVGYQRRTL